MRKNLLDQLPLTPLPITHAHAAELGAMSDVSDRLPAVVGLVHEEFQKLPGTRREAFESLDRPRMKALPSLRFELPQRKRTRANIDYHVEFDDRLYSVPFKLRREPIEVRATPGVVECFHGGVRVASHRRSYARPGTPVTNPEHRPREHRDYGEWSPERMTDWAGKFVAHVAEVARRTMAQYPQPEMGFRPVLGIIRVPRSTALPRWMPRVSARSPSQVRVRRTVDTSKASSSAASSALHRPIVTARVR